MLRIKKILYPTDFSRYGGQALSHVAVLAGQFGAEVHLLHAVRKRKNRETQASSERRLGKVRDELVALMGPAGPKAKIKMARRAGIAPGPVIIDYAGRENIDLVVLATHGRRGIQRFFIGSVAEEVARLAPCSVLTVREALGERPHYRKILAPIDFSVFSKKAMMCARELVKIFESKFYLLHVIEDEIPSITYSVGRRSLLDLVPDLKEKTLQSLKQLAQEADCGQAHLHVDKGHIPRRIEKYVRKRGIELIVIATHGAMRARKEIMGSVTQMVIHHAPCPVLTVRSFGKSLLAPKRRA